jgi:S-DNA-T family DNA segregation ATPase FtsK/SpoIIIE
MHVVLSSQSLAGAYSLPRATLGQMAVRIAMQCSESDAALILSDDNTAARLISRPGEAIYNDAGGLVEGNHPFQVAWLSSSRHREMLSAIASRDHDYVAKLPPPVIFEGNRPCRWTAAMAGEAEASSDQAGLSGLLGESVEIGPPMSVQLSRNGGRNVLMIASDESRGAVLASVISGFVKSDPRCQIVYFDGHRVDDTQPLTPWLAEAGIEAKVVKVRDCESEVIRLHELIQQRNDPDQERDCPPVIVVLDPLERFRDLRQEESFNFSLDASAATMEGSVAFQSVLRDGPPANVFTIVVCGSVETLSRWLPRASHHDLELRILGQMNASDSALLIDSPAASDLSAATMLLYDDSDGRITKFRQCSLPNPAAVKQWLA